MEACEHREEKNIVSFEIFSVNILNDLHWRGGLKYRCGAVRIGLEEVSESGRES